MILPLTVTVASSGEDWKLTGCVVPFIIDAHPPPQSAAHAMSMSSDALTFFKANASR